jgi:hypothetical protein
LCTWLYQADEKSVPIWLDRYYYPDIISRKKALNAKKEFDLSFDNIVDRYYYKDSPGYNNLDIYGKEQINLFNEKLKKYRLCG